MNKIFSLYLLLVLFSCSTVSKSDSNYYSFDEALENAIKRIENDLPERSDVAILDFKSANPNLSSYIIEELYDKLINGRKLSIMERSRIDTIKIEVGYQLSGEVDDNQIINIGKQLGANYVVTGEITYSGEAYRLRVFAIDIEKGRRVASSSLNINSNDRQINYLLTTEIYESTNNINYIGGTGNVTITSLVSGIIIIDGTETSYNIRADGVITIKNLPTGRIFIGVKENDGRIVAMQEPIIIQDGITVSVVISPFDFEYIVISERQENRGRRFGSPREEHGRSNNESQYTASLNFSFYIGKYLVTQREYISLMGNNPSDIIGENLPVIVVEWIDAIRYCNARSNKEGFRPAYIINNINGNVEWDKTSNGYRLPTETEWEYACRANIWTAYYTGTTIDKSQANFGNNRPSIVGAYPPNPWGIYDMAGNVWEWCYDEYKNRIAFFENNFQMILVGLAFETRNTLRGGSFRSNVTDLRSARRTNNMTLNMDDVGFRIVRSPNGYVEARIW